MSTGYMSTGIGHIEETHNPNLGQVKLSGILDS